MPSTQIDRIDGVTTSAAVKVPCKICVNTPITLSGVQTIQGVLLTAYTGPGLPCDRVLVTGQADQTTNGIYLVQTGAWTREPDFDGARDAVTGTHVSIISGTYAATQWGLTTTDNPIVIGTSNIVFAQEPIISLTFSGVGTSTTSNTVGTGAKTFTTQASLPFGVGTFLTIADTANAANYMHGQVTSYSGTTLIMNILDTGGAGTKTAWTITLSSPSGATGAAGTNGTNGLGLPAGRLTLTSGVPVLSSTVSAAGTIYFTPYCGNQIPIYSGATFTMTTFTELSQALTDATKSPSAATTNALYDMFVWNDAGTLRCTRGPVWTAGGGSATARGTGAGSTAISMVNGFYTNVNAITNGPGAGLGTYVGTIMTNGTSTVDFKLGAIAAGGTAGSIGLWNMFNRKRYSAQVGDNTSSWNYTTSTWRAAEGSSTNRVTYVAGLAEEIVEAAYSVQIRGGTLNGSYDAIGVAQDSTSTYNGTAAENCNNLASATTNPTVTAFVDINSGLGQHYMQAVEFGGGTGGTFFGIDQGATTLQTMNFIVKGRF